MKTLTSKLNTLFLILSILVATSCGKKDDSSTNPTIPGLSGPKLTLSNGSLLISMVFDFTLDGGARISPVPNFPKSYMEIGPDLQSDGTLFAINLDILEILDAKLDTFDPQSLPGGRHLPGLSTGKLPGFAATIPKFKNVSFYFGKKLFGVFVPVSLMNKVKNAVISYRFKAGGKRVGNISLVGGDSNGENGGFLLMLDLNAATRKRLQRYALK